MTDRESRLLFLLCHGYSNKAIMEEMGIAFDTVKRHITNIMNKTGLSSRWELMAKYAAPGETEKMARLEEENAVLRKEKERLGIELTRERAIANALVKKIGAA
jgi:DNA-binding CsgD family transcriptional regulator